MTLDSADSPRRLTSAEAAGERYFRLYHKHVIEPDMDTLFNLLEGMHSLNDRLGKETGENFYDFEEFIALNPLRNFFHHHLELLHDVKVIPANLPDFYTDLLHLCLVPKELIEMAAAEIRGHKARGEAAMRCKLKWYAAVVNINPCLFNFSVCAFERLRETELRLTGAEYLAFEKSYLLEEDAGHSHFVIGDIFCHAASVDEILEKVFVLEK